MIGELVSVVEQVGRSTSKLGFGLTSDEDWVARFNRADGSEISITADQVSFPAFTLTVTPNAGHEGFAIWLLMRAFDSSLPDGRDVPSLENQLWFLDQYQATIFSDVGSYKARYDALNK